MQSFDQYLNEVAQRIMIRDEDREKYTKDFDKIRDHIFNGMRDVDSVFKRCYKGSNLFGSYGNNVRIKKPSEFDIVFNLDIPYSSEINIKQDKERPGFINLNLHKVLQRLYAENGQNDIYKRFKDLVDTNNYNLRRTNLQNWLEDVMEACLRKHGYSVNGHWGDLYKLKYSKRGLAHTIYAESGARTISIDLVPGIRFGPAEWMEIRRSPKFADKCTDWYAVPKPSGVGSPATQCYAFFICNPKVEHDLLLGKQNLKVVYRLLKSIRDKYALDRLKSYFFTTAFLWEIESKDEAFWSNSLSIILLHMLNKLVSYFSLSNMPFFWDRKLNLLSILRAEEITKYRSTLQSVERAFLQYNGRCHFKSEEYQKHFEL